VRLKRAFDLTGSLVGLALSSPVWVLAALAIKLTSSGSVLHRATRVGRNGTLFTLYKFRSMRSDPHGGSGLTTSGDPRLTRVGVLLRRFKIDELPQLINVLRGEMSLVGPRPEDPRFVSSYTSEQRRVLEARPGITSPASVAYRDESQLLPDGSDQAERVYRSEIMPAKLTLELDYLDNRTFWSDLRVLARTGRAVLAPSRLR
jgi:lipopolysaccharide/colanic/teichoic acid biosynthesis glycosyltransferase